MKISSTVRRLAAASVFVAAMAAVAGCPPGGEQGSKGGPAASANGQADAGEAPGIKETRKRLSEEVVKRAKILQDRRTATASIKAGFGFTDGSNCVTPPPIAESDVDVDRSLFVHDRATLDGADFSLRHTLTQLATQAATAGATSTTAESIFTELWDTQNPSTAPAGAGAHCDDAGSTINGFPNACRPADGEQAQNPGPEIDNYWAIGLVNRLDLAHEGWRNCGEHRIVYGRKDTSKGREFIIFEAVLPNPKPGCRSACKPVAEMWQSLTSEPNATTRASTLANFYYSGLPGFRPVVHIDHYTAKGVGSSYGSSGSGQIRTNQFAQAPWLLNEFRLALNCTTSPCNLAVVPAMLKVNPFGTLFSQEETTTVPPAPFQAQAVAFQSSLTTPDASGKTQIGNLAGKGTTCPPSFDVNGFSYEVDLAFDAADSAASGSPPDAYTAVYNPAGPVISGLFRDNVQSSPDLCGLNDRQIINRATALSCAGCHQPGAFGLTAGNSIAPGLSWPASLGFVHTSETPSPPDQIHALSPALINEFLPARRKFLVSMLNEPTCDCTGRFIRLPPPLRIKAEAIEKGILEKTQQDISAVNDRLRTAVEKARAAGKPLPFADIRKAQDAVRKLKSDADKKILADLKKEGIDMEPLTPNLKADSIKLERVPANDPKAMREALQKVVLDQVRAEPPRKTVTGHFRVH